MSDEPVLAAFNQGLAPTIACFNHATTPLGVDFDKLIAALQVYVTKYLHASWNLSGTLVKSKDFIKGSWAIQFLDDADSPGALAYHDLTPDGYPLAKVFVRTTIKDGQLVSLSASHELAEMWADAAINMMTTGPDPAAMYAYENADPVQGLSFLINGIPMADFVYPSYFESFRKPRSVKFDEMGAVTRPFEILPEGYQIIFKNGRWSQLFGSTAREQAFAKEDRRGHRSEIRMARTGGHDLAQAVYHVGNAIDRVAKAFTDKPGLNAKETSMVFNALKFHLDKLKGVGVIGAQTLGKELNMAANDLQDFIDLLAQADTETNRIAQRIADLSASIQPGMSQTDVDTIKAGLQTEVDKLKGVGVVPPAMKP